MPTADGPFELDWSDTGGRRVDGRLVVAAAGLAVLLAVYGYDHLVAGADPFGYDVGRLEWLWLACLWVDLLYVGWPAVRDRERTVGFVRALRDRPAGFVAAVVVVAVFMLGTVGPMVVSQPTLRFSYGNQPPLFTSVPADNVLQCYNPAGDRCYGSFRFPLGTTDAGKSTLVMVVLGARVVVMLSTVAVTMVVPVATLAGTVAAYAGGWVDRAVTTVARTLQAVPALLVFLIWRWLAGTDGSLFVLVIVFGFVNWANVALLVRSRALSEVGKGYVRAAEASGAGSVTVVREHLVPNVARTAIAAALYQVPMFVVVEASLSYLKAPDGSTVLGTLPTVESWGRMLGQNVAVVDPYWWRTMVPVAALLVTVAALNVFADAVADLLSPRSGR